VVFSAGLPANRETRVSSSQPQHLADTPAPGGSTASPPLLTRHTAAYEISYLKITARPHPKAVPIYDGPAHQSLLSGSAGAYLAGSPRHPASNGGGTIRPSLITDRYALELSWIEHGFRFEGRAVESLDAATGCRLIRLVVQHGHTQRSCCSNLIARVGSPW